MGTKMLDNTNSKDLSMDNRNSEFHTHDDLDDFGRGGSILTENKE